MSFPLYDNLSKNILKRDITLKQKNDFLIKVGSINKTGRDLLYALVKFYHIHHEYDEVCSQNVPYNGEYKNNAVTWDLLDIPVKLRHILYRFLIIHTKSMEEEYNRDSVISE